MGDHAILPPLAEPKSEPVAPAVPSIDDGSASLDQAAAPLLAAAEALIISSPRPVPALRLAQALGLALPEEPTATEPAPANSSAPVVPADAGSDGQPQPPRKRNRRKAAAGPTPDAVVARIVGLLNDVYQSSGRAFRIEAVAGGYRVMTLPEHGGAIAALQGLTAHAKLSRAAIETLAIIAYRQPVTRAHLEAIRGVACGEVVKTLLDRKLITIAGRAEELGRPLLYATTKQFLAAFGLASIKDLPAPGELGLRAV